MAGVRVGFVTPARAAAPTAMAVRRGMRACVARPARQAAVASHARAGTTEATTHRTGGRMDDGGHTQEP